MHNKRILVLCGLLFLLFTTHAQLPVEVFGGHERSTVDIMFFRYVTPTTNPTVPKRWLFFNRNRASVDYRMTHSTYLPQFGFTEALSYNHEKWKGFAPVAVGQVLNSGVYAKAGLQFAHIRNNMTVFTWLVCETKTQPNIDYFILFRYTPRLTERLKLFTQAECITAVPTRGTGIFSFTQRLRLGLQFNAFQLGAGADLNQTGNTTYTRTTNAGAFIRHEF